MKNPLLIISTAKELVRGDRVIWIAWMVIKSTNIRALILPPVNITKQRRPFKLTKNMQICLKVNFLVLSANEAIRGWIIIDKMADKDINPPYIRKSLKL